MLYMSYYDRLDNIDNSMSYYNRLDNTDNYYVICIIYLLLQ